MDTVIGYALVATAGLATGSCLWPMKVMRTFRFEHYWFVGMLPLIVIPWLVVLIAVPDPWGAYAGMVAREGWKPLLMSNLWAIAWGVANVLAGICVARIGYALTGAILTALGLSIAVLLPMVVKGTGQFAQSPDLTSPAGLTTALAVAVLVVGVVFTALAGFGRDRVLKRQAEAGRPASGGFLGGLIMVVIAGVCSAGMPLAFVYGQGPIREAIESHGAGQIPANMGVWAAALFGGAMVNLIYPAVLMTKKRSWGVLGQRWQDLLLAVLIGTQLITGFALAGRGSLLLGALGASIGFGVQQSTQIMGTQGVGFISGEWRGVHGKPRRQMYAALAILAVGLLIMAYARSLS